MRDSHQSKVALSVLNPSPCFCVGSGISAAASNCFHGNPLSSSGIFGKAEGARSPTKGRWITQPSPDHGSRSLARRPLGGIGLRSYPGTGNSSEEFLPAPEVALREPCLRLRCWVSWERGRRLLFGSRPPSSPGYGGVVHRPRRSTRSGAESSAAGAGGLLEPGVSRALKRNFLSAPALRGGMV